MKEKKNWIEKAVKDCYGFMYQNTGTMVNPNNDWRVVSLPLVDCYGDILNLYVQRTDDEFIISDDGYVTHLWDLKDIQPQRRQEIKDEIHKLCGINMKEDELVLRCTEEHLPIGLFRMMISLFKAANFI